MKVQRLVVLTALAVALVLVAVGCEQKAPPPADYVKLVAVQAPALINAGTPFDVDAYGEDLASTDTAIIYRFDEAPADLEFTRAHLIGSDGSINNCDGSWCENGSATTLTIAHARYLLVWRGAKGASFPITICGYSFSNPPPDGPYSGDCVTKHITVAP